MSDGRSPVLPASAGVREDGQEPQFELDAVMIDFVRESMVALGIGVTELFPSGRDWVSDPPNQVTWQQLAAVFLGLSRGAGSEPGLAVLGPVAVDSMVRPAFGRLEGLLRKPHRIYRSGFGRQCIERFLVFDHEMTEVEGGWLEARISVRPEFAQQLAGGGELSPVLGLVFELFRSMAVAFPTRFGLAMASVDERRRGLTQTLTIAPPRSGDLWARLQRACDVILADVPEGDRGVATANLALMREHRASRRSVERERQRADQLGRVLDRSEERAIVRALAFEALGHRIRTPLQAIVGGLDDLIDEVDDRQRPLVDTLLNCSDELTAAIDDVLDLSRTQTAVAPLNLQPCDFRVEFGEWMRAYNSRAEELSRSFQWRLDGELPRVLLCDLRRVRQVVDCLVDNALRHAKHGDIEVQVETEFRSHDGLDRWYVEIEVIDQGCGIDFETRANLFESNDLALFQSGEEQTEAGAAIGLCAARHIAAAMRATISVESEVDRGSRFRLVLNLEEPQDSMSLSRSQGDLAMHCLPEKIMLIAGALDWRPRVIEMLGELGISVVQAAAPEVAFELLARDQSIDLVMVDAADASPGRLDLVHALRRRVGTLTPIVAVSPAGASCGRSRWRAAGVSHFLKMPTTQSRLETQLEYWMSGYERFDSDLVATNARLVGRALPARGEGGEGGPAGDTEDGAEAGVDESRLEVTNFTDGSYNGFDGERSPAGDGEHCLVVKGASAPEQGAAASSLASQLEAIGEGIPVLLVDDNGVNREVMARMLRKFGCGVACAENGKIAVELATQVRFVAIFMDCEMPVMDGFDATRAIRRAASPYRETPIIATTAYASDSDRRACELAGMDDFLVKPVTRDRLRVCLERWRTAGASTAAKRAA